MVKIKNLMNKYNSSKESIHASIDDFFEKTVEKSIEKKLNKVKPSTKTQSSNGIKNLIKEKKDKIESLNESSDKSSNEESQEQSKLNFNMVPFDKFDLHESLLEACRNLNFTQATPIQQETFKVTLEKENQSVIGIADTGSGKTLAFLLPAFHHLLTSQAKASPCSIVVLVPTRELAQQVRNVADAIGSQIGCNTMLLCGGEEIEKQMVELKKNKPPLIVGTPGRIAQLLTTNNFNLNFTRYLILDEADKMLGIEYHDYVMQIVTKSFKRKATYLFSATMTKQVKKVQKLYLDPNLTSKIQVNERKYSTVDTLKQSFLFTPEKQRHAFLTYLMNELSGKRIFIFASENVTCIKLTIMLRSLGFTAVPLAGLMKDQDRTNCLRRFQAGETSVLIATDIAARGLDIPDVEVVINYEIPLRSKDYIHRVGRTARIGRGGEAITLVSQYDLVYFQKIEQLTGVQMKEYPHTKEHIQVLLKSVDEAWKLAEAKIKDRDSFPASTTHEDRVIDEAIQSLTKKRKRQDEKFHKKKKSKDSKRKS